MLRRPVVRSAVKWINGFEIAKACSLEHPARRQRSWPDFADNGLGHFRQEFEHNFVVGK